MTIVDWLAKEPKGALSRLAREVGISRVTLYQIAQGQRPCPARVAVSLARVTRNEIEAEQFPAVRSAVTVANAVRAMRRGKA